jgi:hypothetical protein
MAGDFHIETNSDAKMVPKRLAFIKGRTAARVKADEEEMVMTIPNLVVREAIAFMLMVIILACLSLFFNAPLEWLADTEHTPNPAKAPWYFLGLQELLHYFPPIVAGVLLPTLVVVALIVIPYFPVNVKLQGLWKENRRLTLATVLVVTALLAAVLLLYKVYAILVPTILVVVCMLVPYVNRKDTGIVSWLGSRSLSWWVMTWFVLIVVVLTAIGVLFRGPEWSWTWPWKEIY